MVFVEDIEPQAVWCIVYEMMERKVLNFSHMEIGVFGPVLCGGNLGEWKIE